MVSFLINCPQCGVMFPTGGSCPDCHWSERGEHGAVAERVIVREFKRRMRRHKRNYAVFMVLMFAAGLVSILAAVQWWKAIYLGDAVALATILVLTIVAGGLNMLLFCAKHLFPVDVNCPACAIELEDLGIVDRHCPSCSACLR